MVGGFYTGFAGLVTYEKAISNASNNSTNVNTAGHKSNEIRFEDFYYKNGIGKGTGIQTIDKNMEQGDITFTGNALDVAIEGRGYFIANDENLEVPVYTRAGNFKMGADGTLQSLNNNQILGRGFTLANVVSTDANDNQFTNEYSSFIVGNSIETAQNVFSINGRSTDYSQSATDGGVSGNGFKTASSKIIDIEALTTNYREKIALYESNPDAASTASINQVTQVSYSDSLNSLQDENDYIEVTVNNVLVRENYNGDLDSTLNNLSDRISNMQGLTSSIDSTTGILNIESIIPGETISVFDAGVNGSLVDISNTQEASVGSGLAMIESARVALKNAIESADAKYLEFTSNVEADSDNLDGLTPISLKLADLNLSENVFGEISIENGFVFLTSDSNKFVVSKLETAFFTNDSGLYATGDNHYQSSEESGPAKNTGITNSVISASLEKSNISSAETMTNILIFQKAFEANAKTLTTADEMLKLALQLR
jgi:flagellar hook protein FlgE